MYPEVYTIPVTHPDLVDRLGLRRDARRRNLILVAPREGRGWTRADLLAAADRLIAQYRTLPEARRPRAWFTYHVHYKAPDWIGPRVADALEIAYVIAEGSRAAKRADGPWALGHQGAEAALKSVNDGQQQASALSDAYERGETIDIAKVMLARQQAQVGFEATLQVRNKLLSAYKDIMSMPV